MNQLSDKIGLGDDLNAYHLPYDRKGLIEPEDYTATFRGAVRVGETGETSPAIRLSAFSHRLSAHTIKIRLHFAQWRTLPPESSRLENVMKFDVSCSQSYIGVVPHLDTSLLKKGAASTRVLN